VISFLQQCKSRRRCQTTATQDVKLVPELPSLVNIVSVATIVSVAWERLYDLQPWTNLALNKNECLTFHIVSKVLGQIVRERKSEGPEGF